MTLRNVIFDWSGTLVDDLPATWEATNHVLSRAGRDPVSLEWFRAEFFLPFQHFYERVAPEVPLDQLELWFHEKFQTVQDSVVALPHARDFLAWCRDRSLRTFLLSAVHQDYFQEQSRRLKFDQYLDRPYVAIRDKREFIHRLLEENGLNPDETLFVGDMEHDMETARHGGVASCAVLTGFTGVDQLRESRPDCIVEHLGELRRLLEGSGLQWPPGDPSVGQGAAATAFETFPIPTVGALVFNGLGEVLMVRTHKWSDLWGIPGGKIRRGERAEDALRRELREETGLEIQDIRFVLVQDCIHSAEFYRAAHFLLLNYTCRVDGRPQVVLNEEAQAWRWVPPQATSELSLNTPTRVLLESVGVLTKDGGA